MVELDPFWQVIIGSAIGGLLLELYLLFKGLKRDWSPGEPQKMAWTSIVIGLLFFIPFLFLVGLVFAGIPLIFNKNKKFPKLGFIMNLVAGGVQVVIYFIVEVVLS